MIEVCIVTNNRLLAGHIEVSACTEPRCPDWHALIIYQHGTELLAVALSPGGDRELARRLDARADSVTMNPQQAHDGSPEAHDGSPGALKPPLTVYVDR